MTFPEMWEIYVGMYFKSVGSRWKQYKVGSGLIYLYGSLIRDSVFKMQGQEIAQPVFLVTCPKCGPKYGLH